ncbi:hypothetical protein AB0D47_20040 [Streptomyces sp. NPDC048376]|uniref:hypothetical protein n=1 Tax=Streptomyces sp. NPDC048376 TaxID=3154926 RepID=UPI00343EADC0
MTATLENLAVTGRRIEFAYHRSLIDDTATLWAPGIITGTETGLNGSLLARVRLDGRRSSLTIPVAYEGLRYLDEVVTVPELPMGRFLPTADEAAFYEKAGVVIAPIGEDGEELVILTGDLGKARAAALAHARDIDLDEDYIDLGALKAAWAVFEWEPEDGECLWTVRLDACEGDDMAVRVHYLPA